MMRLSVPAALLAVGVLIGLSAEKLAVAAPRAPTVKVANVSTDYTITYNSQAGKVRTYDLPPNYDEKGNPKKYTKEELQKLKGDDPAEKKLPGYKADFPDLKVGDYVEVSVSVFKPTKTSSADKTKEAAPDADKPEADATPEKSGKWVVQQQLAGKVTKIVSDSSKGKKGKKAKTESDPKVTVHVTTQVLTGRSGKTNTKNPAQTFDPEKYTATVIVITRSGTATTPTTPSK
jgi:hypothetical protein